MIYDDEAPVFNQPVRPPYESHEPFSKDRRGIYRPPYFFANSASLIMALIGTVFFFISFGGPAWYVVPPENTIIPKTFGLWRLCVRSECVVDMTNDYMVKRYLVGITDTSSNKGVNSPKSLINLLETL